MFFLKLVSSLLLSTLLKNFIKSDLGQLENPVMDLLFGNRRGENHFVCLFL